MCLRASVDGVLGQQRLDVATEFAKFRRDLESKTFRETDEEITALQGSPYLYRRTTLSVLLALVKRFEVGAQLEHALANLNVILPLIWDRFRKPEKWQTGTTYAELHSAGRSVAVAGLKKALMKVRGFDFVPESLRSNTFVRAAQQVIEAHEGMNNFYNEPAPMRLLASLGTTIPQPALGICTSATLSVYLGNPWGIAWNAQPAATQVIEGLTNDRWEYFLNEVLPADVRIRYKLRHEKPTARWIELVRGRELNARQSKNAKVMRLLKASAKGDTQLVKALAEELIADYQRNG